MNETSKARRRRRGLGWYDRYIIGYVVDVGCGSDPVIPNARRFDLEHGDAQYIESIRDESVDCLYSSHCLEHMRDPREALRNWWRVVKPGGYLIVIVPDANLYEQGMWPSIHNSDHKVTFSASDSNPWSPVHYNLTSLVDELPNHRLIHLAVCDSGYDYGIATPTLDQSSGGAECSVEMVAQKVVEVLEHRTMLRNIMLCPKCERLTLIARGTLPSGELDCMCNTCGQFCVVTLKG